MSVLRAMISRWRARVERGAAAVEFAILAFPLALIVCGALDFGLMFSGYYGLENGVAAGARNASLGQWEYGGSAACTAGSGVSTDTTQLICSVAAASGSLTGTKVGTLQIGICFVTPGNAASCSGTPTSSGISVTQDVEVCAQVTLSSTTGLTALFLNGQTASTSSRLVIEQPLPSGTATAYGAYNSSNTGTKAVTYGAQSITGMNCT